MNKLKLFLKLALTAYVGGMIGLWSFIMLALIFYPDYNAILNLLSGIVVLPFTPLGVPFFMGAIIALTLRNKNEIKPDLGPGHE